jgi:hypothetical protein
MNERDLLARRVLEGRAAHADEHAKSDNPYPDHRSLDHVAWSIGFDSAALELVDRRDRGYRAVLEGGLEHRR